MRPHLPFVDTTQLAWANYGPGRYSKMLSRDPDTGAHTALYRLVPAESAIGQSKAHYHHTTEEILVLDGMMSFDRRVWLHRGGYVYHPAETVHGFGSSIPVETQYLSRLGRDLDFNYVDQPLDDFPYFVGTAPPMRPLSVHASPFAHRWQPLLDEDERYARVFELSSDTQSHEGSRLVRYDAGAKEPAGCRRVLERYEEMFVIEGCLKADSGERFAAGSYAFLPPGSLRPKFEVPEAALVYVNYGPRPTSHEP